MLHQCEETERESQETARRIQPNRPRPHITGPDQSKPCRTGFNRTEQICSALNLQELNWTEPLLRVSKVEKQTERFGTFLPNWMFEQNQRACVRRRAARRFGWC